MYQDKHKKSREAITYQIKYALEQRILLEIDKHFTVKKWSIYPYNIVIEVELFLITEAQNTC